MWVTCSFCNESNLKCVYSYCTHEQPKREFYYNFIDKCYVDGQMDGYDVSSVRSGASMKSYSR